MRESNEGVQVIGSFNAENLYYDLATQTTKSLISTTGRGYYILGLIAPNHEPSNHTLRDIAIYKSALEEWGQSVVLLFESQDAATRFVDEGFDLPDVYKRQSSGRYSLRHPSWSISQASIRTP